jgi:4-diphosphocytidyl-2C-methyl-D-erythritol kinase
MRQRDAFMVSMTGTGPTCFSLFLSEKDRDRAFQSLSAAMPEVRWFKTELSSFLDPLEG